MATGLVPPRTRQAPFEWHLRSSEQKRAIVAAGLGWMLDAFDVMLYSVALATLLRDFGMSRSVAGRLNTVTLVASAIGGVGFGFLADRYGRARLLSVSVLLYSVFTAACGLATTILLLGIFRFLLGLGMGGEWNTGAALVAETWPAELRGRALAIVQSAWGFGYALAAIVAAIAIPRFGWRPLFFIGVTPALLVWWITSRVDEPAEFTQAPKQRRRAWLLTGTERRSLLVLFAMNTCGMFAWWGIFNWLPAYLELPPARSGLGFSQAEASAFIVILNIAGMVPGYLTLGYFADRLGRRPVVVSYLAIAAGIVPLFVAARSPLLIIITSSLLAFFGTGFFAGSAILGSELFSTEIRASALGVTYNVARAIGAFAPWAIGKLSEPYGLNHSFLMCAAAFAVAAFWALLLPEPHPAQTVKFGLSSDD